MNAPSREAQRQYGEDEAATICLVVLTAALPLGLLAASIALPLHWLAGQAVLTVLCLLVLAVSSVWSTSRRAGMDILSARLYGRAVLTSQLAVTAMLCVVFPVAEARVRGTGGDPFSWGYGLASLLSIALCGVTVTHGTSRTRVWTLLEVQVWESDDEGGSRVGSMSRDLLAAQTRLSLAAGTLVLAVALLAQSRAGPGPEIATWLGVAAFAVYLVCALVFAGLSAHRSKMAQWRLAGSDVAAGVGREWRRAGSNMVLLALALAALLVATRLPSALRALGAWLWDGLILPLLRLLPWSWFKIPAAKPCLSGACTHAGSSERPFARPALPKVQAHSSAGIWALLGDLWHALTRAVQYLAGQWPLLLCLVAAIALARVYLSSGRGQGVRRFWRTFGVMLGRYARLLWGLLFASTENLAARARLLAARGPVRAATAIRRMRGTSLGDMSPRQAVVALYLTALRHAAHRGYARRAGQTPAEYARDLAARVPEAGDPAGKLTETFIVARYGAATVDKARVEQARALWGRVRQALRGRRHRPDSRA